MATTAVWYRSGNSSDQFGGNGFVTAAVTAVGDGGGSGCVVPRGWRLRSGGGLTSRLLLVTVMIAVAGSGCVAAEGSAMTRGR